MLKVCANTAIITIVDTKNKEQKSNTKQQNNKKKFFSKTSNEKLFMVQLLSFIIVS